MFLLALSLGVGLYILTTIEIPTPQEDKNVEFQIPQIDTDENVDMVKVLLLFHAADYFVYRGTQIGFQYEMLRELENELGVTIHIRLEVDARKIKEELFSNNYDLLVMDYRLSNFVSPFIERSIPHSVSHPVLVSGNKADTLTCNQIQISYDFLTKISFPTGSPYLDCDIYVNTLHTTEELFEKVNKGAISYLVCDYNQAITLMPFYSNVQILEKAGQEFERRWFLNKNNTQLNEDINHWLLDFKKTEQYRLLLKKYFSRESTLLSRFQHKQNRKISIYDDIIKKYSHRYGFDWRFVASIIYQETNFISGLTGRGGSYGLMQLMPSTMEYHGISEEDDDEANIHAGIQHLRLISTSFEDVADEVERLYFIASSYNAGRGHIFDAQRLAIKQKEDHNKWENVSKYLILKSQIEFATDSVVKWGYFPGAHTVNYTQQVMDRYFAYKLAYP